MKILWFSRHNMTPIQYDDLCKIYDCNVEIKQVNRTIKQAYELMKDMDDCDAAAVVMPLNLQEQMLSMLDDKPMLISKNHRVMDENGNFKFIHAGWEQIKEIKIVKEVLSSYELPENVFR